MEILFSTKNAVLKISYFIMAVLILLSVMVVGTADVFALNSDSSQMAANYDSAKESYKDVVAWITIDDTRIDYAVFQSTNNTRYLSRDRNNKKSVAAEVFADYRNMYGESFDNNMNLVIYGHRMKNGTMFADLFKFKKSDFFDSHRIVKYYTPTGYHEYEIFSAYVTDTKFNYIKTSFSTEEQFNNLMALCATGNKGKYKPNHNNGVVPAFGNQVLTLSTCSYEFKNARFVVQAVRIS